MKIVASSDWHLDQNTAGVDRFDDTCAAIDVTVDAAIEMDADAYLMCGDLTDPNNVRSHRAVAKACEVDRRLSNARIRRLWVVGNHDVIEDGAGMSTLEALKWTGGDDRVNHVIDRPCAFDLASADRKRHCNIIGLPFTPSSHPYDPDQYIRDLAAEGGLAAPVVVVGHLNAEGISPGSETTEMPRGRDVYWPMDALAECFPDAILIGGHYHAPQNYKGLEIIGSMARLRFDERDNDLGYMVMEV